MHHILKKNANIMARNENLKKAIHSQIASNISKQAILKNDEFEKKTNCD